MTNGYTDIILTILSNNRAKIYFVLKTLVAVSLIIYLFTFVELKNIISTFQDADLFMLSLSIVLLIPNILLQYWKWKFTCNHLIKEGSGRKIMLSLFYGFPAAVFTPGRTGEYFGRGLAFKDRHFSEIIIATAVDKFFTILITFISGSIGMILFINKYYESAIYVPLPLMIAFFLFIALAIAFILGDKEWFFDLLSPLFKYKFFTRISDRLGILRNLDREFAYKMIFISTLFFLCYLLQFSILFIAYSHHTDFIMFLLAALIIMFTKSVLAPISISELGVREGAAVFFLTAMGESSVSGLNASLTLFAINIIIPSLIGLVLLFVRNDD